MRHLTLKWRLILLVGTCLLLLTLSSILVQTWSNREIVSLIHDNSHDLEVLDDVGQIRISFATEVQEWKNILIRGADPESYKKHSSAFDKAVEKALEQAKNLRAKLDENETKYIDDFIVSQEILRKAYSEARLQFVNGTVFEPSQADKAVSGKDRKVTESLAKLIEMIALKSKKHVMEGEERLNLHFQAGFFGSLALSLLLMAIAFITATRLSGNLTKIIQDVSVSSRNVDQVSQELTTASAKVSSGAAEAASSLEETVASLEELSSMVKASAENAKHAFSLSSNSKQTAELGEKEMSQLSEAMFGIVTSSKKIKEIISIIDDIAFQTNLLALNAAVEAARAGEQGKGFAVVAEAVRNLAQRSAEAAKDISRLIQESVSQIESGNEKAKSSGQILKNIVESVKKVSELNLEISNATTEQSNGIQQISQAMSTLDSSTQQNAAASETVADSAQLMAHQAVSLQGLVMDLTFLVNGKRTDNSIINSNQKVRKFAQNSGDSEKSAA